MTLVELIIASVLLSFIVAGGYRAMSVFAGRMSQDLSRRLVLQMEARRALLNLYREVQEGIEVILPIPGNTLPYLVFRDISNNLQVIYLEVDPELSLNRVTPIFRAMIGTKDPDAFSSKEPKMLMRYVTSLNFTAHHHGAVTFQCTLRHGRGKFSLVNHIRLKNTAAE